MAKTRGGRSYRGERSFRLCDEDSENGEDSGILFIMNYFLFHLNISITIVATS